MPAGAVAHADHEDVISVFVETGWFQVELQPAYIAEGHALEIGQTRQRQELFDRVPASTSPRKSAKVCASPPSPLFDVSTSAVSTSSRLVRQHQVPIDVSSAQVRANRARSRIELKLCATRTARWTWFSLLSVIELDWPGPAHEDVYRYLVLTTSLDEVEDRARRNVEQGRWRRSAELWLDLRRAGAGLAPDRTIPDADGSDLFQGHGLRRCTPVAVRPGKQRSRRRPEITSS